MLAFKYILLGFIQGLTEFLPVSSSAHLVISQNLLGIEENQILLDIVLHLGTLCALILFLHKDLKYFLNKKFLLLISLVTAITAGIVIAGGDFFESMFLSAQKVAIFLFITGIILLFSKRFIQGKRPFDNLGIADAFWLGIVQGLAVIPGISRSGVTISTLLFRHAEKDVAFKFSFLACIPAILGALIYKISDFSILGWFELRYMIFGFFASFISGLLALRILLRVIRQAHLHFFGYYCLTLALVLWIT